MRTATFDSHLFDYRVRHPLTWIPHASEATDLADHIDGVGYTWTGIARFVKPGTSSARYVRDHPLDRLEGGRCVVEQADGTRSKRAPDGSTEWKPTRIDGRRAVARSACGYTDAVVIVGDEAFTFTLHGHGLKADRGLFATIAATIVLPRAFVSKAFGYQLLLPATWKPRPAAESDASDRFSGPKGQALRIMRHPFSGDDPVTWAEDHVARPQADPGGRYGCWWKGGGIIWTGVTNEHFIATKVSGHDAAIRSACGFIDAAIAVGDRIYVMTLEAGRRGPGGDLALFGMLTRALVLKTG